MKPQSNLSKKDAVDLLWRRGNLFFLCHSVQQEMYKVFYKADPNSILVWLLARQTGKSFLIAVLALEQAIREKNSIVKILTDTKIHMQNIIIPIMNQILEDCPKDLKPEYLKAESRYVFPNGSQIQLAGSDGRNYERLRGQKSSLVLVDEAGFCDNLTDAVKSVLLPTTTHTGGKIVLASTPSSDYDHEFNNFIEEADLNNSLVKKTIYDNPLLSKEQIERIIEQMGGINSEQFQREYLCKIIKDSSTAVLPEVTPELLDKIVKEWPKPPFYDCYEAMDLGFNDLTVILFGYFDFRADKLIIEDEWVAKGNDVHIDKMIQSIREKEKSLWYNVLTNEQRTPAGRVSDINYIVMEEISRRSDYQIKFTAAKKDDKDAALNNLRMMLGAGKIIIHPRCETLIRHLRNVRWKSATDKKTFARSPDDGHYDAVDAITYLVRHVQYTKNPYPSHYGLSVKDCFGNFVQNPTNSSLTQQQNVFKKIFNRRSNASR